MQADWEVALMPTIDGRSLPEVVAEATGLTVRSAAISWEAGEFPTLSLELNAYGGGPLKAAEITDLLAPVGRVEVTLADD